jgi:hypothetical protein
MEEEVKKWLEKKKSELSDVSYTVPAPESKPEPKVEPEQPKPTIQAEQSQPTKVEQQEVSKQISEVSEEVEKEVGPAKPFEAQRKIASDIEGLRAKEQLTIKTSGLLTTKAKILLVAIIALTIFIIYWVYVCSPTLLSS